MEIQSGYKTITPTQLGNALSLIDTGQLSHVDLRLYLACFVMVAIREAAARCRRQRRETAREFPRYRVSELERLTQLNSRTVRRAIGRLRATGLAQVSEGELVIAKEPLPGAEALIEELACRRSPRRPIPMPRSMLRFLAQNPLNSLTVVILAYCARGLSIARGTGDISARGTVKASWIAETFGLSLRSVRYAQERLREMGWISRDTQSNQCKLNRHGAYFEINVNWTNLRTPESAVSRDEPKPCPETAPSLVKRDKSGAPVAPPPPETCTPVAPPMKDLETSDRRSKDRKTHPPEPVVPGVCSGKGRNFTPPPVPSTPPDLTNIHPGDLWRFDRLEALYFEAVERGWINSSEAMALNFLAAAVRAREAGLDPVRLFVALVRGAMWSHITQAQEERARQALVRFREDNWDRFRAPPKAGHHGSRRRNPEAA